MKKIIVSVLASLTLVSTAKAAKAAPALEALLPAEAVLVIAAPNYASAKKHFKGSASGQFWDSAEFRPFRKKLADVFEANVLAKIEEALAVDLETFEEMASGPVALAIVAGQDGVTNPSLLLLLDAGRKSFTLRRTLARMEREWKKAKRNVSQTEIGGIDFTTVSDPKGNERVHVGRVGTQLIVGTVAGQIEGVLARLGGGGGGTLAGNPAFAADHGALLKGADFYLWANLGQVIPQLLDNAPDGAELGIDFGEVIGKLGLDGLGTVAITYSERPDGTHSDLFVGLPEAKRTGLFGLLETKRADASPPSFVPANVGAFTRWRVDMGAAWKKLEALLLELSPDVANMVEFTVGLLGKDKDPNFDFKKSFLNNFGDDLMIYQMPPKGLSLNDLGSGPMVALFKSPNPAELIQGIGAVPGILPPPLNEAVLEPRKLGEHTAHLLQGLLDGKAQQPLAKRDRLAAAVAAVGGTDSGFFGYQNDRVVMLSMMDTLRANADQFEMIFSMIPMEGLDEVSLNDWLDFSLLPKGGNIAKYFDITVSGAKTDARGVTLKFFSPRPPGLKR